MNASDIALVFEGHGDTMQRSFQPRMGSVILIEFTSPSHSASEGVGLNNWSREGELDDRQVLHEQQTHICVCRYGSNGWDDQ